PTSAAVNSGGLFVSVTPSRILDTRGSPFGPKGSCTPSCGSLGAGGTLKVQVAGQGGVPATSPPPPPSAVVMNVTETNASGPQSFMTVYPSDVSRPNAPAPTY